MPEHMNNPNSELDGNFKRLFEQAPLPFHSLDHKGSVLQVNAAWLRLMGYERADVIGRSILDFVMVGYQRQLKSSFKTLQKGGTIQNRIVEMQRANGSAVMVEASVSADFTEDAEFGQTYAILRDISAQPSDVRGQDNLARRHALILNATPGAIIGFDENRLITFANPATERITGWGPQDLQGMDLHRQLHGASPDDRPKTAEQCSICQAIENQQSSQGETQFKRKDGTLFPVEYSTEPYFVAGVYAGGVLSFNDTTERLAAQEELRQSEEQFRHLFKNAPVALWLEDFSAVKIFLDELQAKGITADDLNAHFIAHPEDLFKCMELVKINDVNQATLDLHRAQTIEELTNSLAETLTDDGVVVFRQEMVALAKGESGTEAMTSIKTVDGEVRHVMFKVFRDMTRDNWDTSYLAFTDLTEFRRIEKLNTRLATAIEQSGDNIIITDQDGTIEYCNPAFEKITGYSREEAKGQTPRMLKSGNLDDLFYQNLWETITAGKVWVGSFINRRKNGELFEEEGSISPVFDNKGNIVNFVSVKRDVTRQLELERRLVQSQKMEAVGQLAGGVAHDFNNILHAMLGHLEFAQDENTTTEDLHTELQMLRSGVDRASQLTRQLLAFSRRQVLELKNIDPNDLIAQLLKMVRRVIGEDIELDFRPGNINHDIHVDTGQIEQVLLNLCLNARDAMPEGGTLRIETQREVVSEEFVSAHTWADAGPHIMISVSDNGVGIDPKIMAQIFEPFFTTKERGRGTGLGLATVYGTVKQHGGMILVESKIGEGTTFKILLPTAERLTDANAAKEQQKLPSPGGTETILLAEDDDAVRNVINRVLTRAGYQVIEAQDGQEALTIFTAYADQIDLALLDMVMPMMGGAEVAREIQAKRPAVKILFNTGYSEDTVRGRISPNSQAPLMMKPHDPRSLLECIRKLLDAPSGS